MNEYIHTHIHQIEWLWILKNTPPKAVQQMLKYIRMVIKIKFELESLCEELKREILLLKEENKLLKKVADTKRNPKSRTSPNRKYATDEEETECIVKKKR